MMAQKNQISLVQFLADGSLFKSKRSLAHCLGFGSGNGHSELGLPALAFVPHLAAWASEVERLNTGCKKVAVKVDQHPSLIPCPYLSFLFVFIFPFH